MSALCRAASTDGGSALTFFTTAQPVNIKNTIAVSHARPRNGWFFRCKMDGMFAFSPFPEARSGGGGMNPATKEF
jgi:hypothetical protein